MTYCMANYTTQCKDTVTGEVGCFLFDIEHWKRTGEFQAISPVFKGLVAFYKWDNENGKKRRDFYHKSDAIMRLQS